MLLTMQLNDGGLSWGLRLAHAPVSASPSTQFVEAYKLLHPESHE